MILRMPACGLLVCLVWWGPLVPLILAIKYWGRPPEIPQNEFGVLMALVFLGWSILITTTLCHRVIEPFFNVRSLQNRNRDLFRPEPYYFTSFREWARWMFVGTEEPPAQTGTLPQSGKSGRQSKRSQQRKPRGK